MRVMQPNLLSGKYIFIKNYDFPTYRKDVAFFNFKKNDVIDVDYIYPKPSYNSLVGNYTEPAHLLYKSDLNNLSIKIPFDYVRKVDNNTNLSKISTSNQITSVETTNTPVKLATSSQDAEDKFYEKLGIETQSGGMMSGRLDSKLKGRFLVAVVLVAGYLAYKKFKK